MTSERKGVAKGSKGALSRAVIKVMGLFTGLQTFNILCSIIKNKLVALWLGATGVGLFGIFNLSMETITSLTDMGLRQSTVRQASRAADSPTLFARVVALIRRWSLLAGLFGAVVMSGLSPVLSNIFYNDFSHWWAFTILSGAIMMNALVNGEQALLQGSRRLRQLASSSLWASITGLAVSIPMFYFLGEVSVELSIISYSAAALAFILAVRVRPVEKVRIDRKTLWREGNTFVRLGVSMAVAGFISNACQLGFLAFLTRYSNEEMVGYYQAGATLVVRYMGLIFTAVGMEYYPRLAAAWGRRRRISVFVTHEMILLLLVLTPVILIFLAFRGVIVDLLYKPEFGIVIPMVTWGIVSALFKASSWCLSFTIIAAGDSKMYLITEGIDAVIGLGLNILFYYLWGLAGVGVSLVVWFALYTLMCLLVYRRHYSLSIDRRAWIVLAICLIVCLSGIGMLELLGNIVGGIICVVVALVFIYPIKKMLN